MTVYTIVKPRTGRYHKETIKAGFDIMERYHSQLLSFCGEMPRLPLTKEEIFSDLIIDRVPRFLVNFRGQRFNKIQELLRSDLSPVMNKRKFEHNKTVLMQRIQSHKSPFVNGKLQRKVRTAADIAELKILKEQVAYLQRLRSLVKVEKSLLVYLRSCVRRTKIKYLQQLRNTVENKLTTAVDPTNGMLEIPEREEDRDFEKGRELDTDSPVIAQEMLEQIGLMPEDQEVLMLALVYERSFPQIGTVIGCSRSTAARRYQRAYGNMVRLCRSKNLTFEKFTGEE